MTARNDVINKLQNLSFALISLHSVLIKRKYHNAKSFSIIYESDMKWILDCIFPSQ